MNKTNHKEMKKLAIHPTKKRFSFIKFTSFVKF